VAKETGLGWTTLTVDDGAGSGQDVRNDTNTLEFATPRAVLEVTGIDVSAMERLLGLADFSITLNGTFNDAAGASHVTFKTIATVSIDRTVAIGVSGQTLSVECKLTDYALKRGDDGALTWEVPGVLANGVAPAWS
jgi:hypothetical protein